MKQFISKNLVLRNLTTFSLLFLAASCSNTSHPKQDEIALTFLTSYFNLDFEQTLPLCGEVLKADLEQSAIAISGLSQGAQDKLRNELSVYSFKIEKVELNNAKDSAFVSYNVFMPEAPEGVPSHLTMAKEKHEWKVVKLL
jgi:hypothetical protein